VKRLQNFSSLSLTLRACRGSERRNIGREVAPNPDVEHALLRAAELAAVVPERVRLPLVVAVGVVGCVSVYG
jgi:hypothetical protein